jgi:hypothetical protein
MDIKEIDRAVLKSTIREILMEDANIFEDIIEKILSKNDNNIKEPERLLPHKLIEGDVPSSLKLLIEKDVDKKEEDYSQEELEQLIDEEFEKYDEVFKALA